jgi:hypothetical protein
LNDEAFHALLDEHGMLRGDATLAPPDPTAAYMVFAQRPDAGLDIVPVAHHAERFFGAELALTVPKRSPFGPPRVDAALVRLAPSNVPGGTRLCYGRPSTESDLDRAHRAEMRVGYTGLFDLARRCPTVWLIVTEADADPTALLLAAIFASVMLGPIVSPDGTALFGVRTARQKLEEMATSYR